VDRLVRLTAVAIGLLALGLGSMVGRDVQALVDRPHPGLSLFANCVVPYPTRGPDGSLALERFERVVALEGRPVASAREIHRTVAAARPGTAFAYTFERLDGTRHEVSVASRRLAASDVYRIYLVSVFAGFAFLAVGMVPALARPSLPSARALLAASAGLSIPMGILIPDHYETYRLGPWARLGSFLAVGGMLHLGLLFPERRWPLTSYPRALPFAIYSGAGLLAVGNVVGFLTSTRLLAATAVGILAGTVLGFGLLAGNLAVTALRSPDAPRRRQAQVALLGPAAMVAGLLAFAVEIWSPIPLRVPRELQLLPALLAALSLAYAMIGTNLFELDAVVRRGLAFGALALAAIALQLGVFSALQSLLGTGPALASTLAAAALVLVAVPTVGPLRSRLEAGVEAALFPAQRRARELVAAAGREVAALRPPAELAGFLRAALCEALGCESLRLVAGPPDRALEEIGPAPSTAPISLAPADALYVALRRGRRVFADAPGPQPQRSGASRGAVQRLAGLGLALAVPLPPSEARIGALLLSRRRDGRQLTPEDAALVATLAGQATLALENAAALASLQQLERRLAAENVYLRGEAGADLEGGLVGRSPALRALLEQIERVGPTDSPVLVEGETGVGKELVVRALHARSPRRGRPLVAVACAAVPEPLFESELFGHERGAFTGAAARKLGRFEVADGGTLLLDDVDTLPLAVQAKLLRAVQDGELQRLGSSGVRRVDVRVVAATNRDLLAEVRAGRFREDLYYRLAVVPLRVPPLRERREDVPLLVEHFARREGARIGRVVRSVAAEALAELVAYDWPGNVRELRSVVERALVMDTGDVLRLPAPLVAPAPGGTGEGLPELGTAPLGELVNRYKGALAREALSRVGGNQRQAAELLGLHRPSLTRMLRTLALAAGTAPERAP
jgi:transcriptional regulator with GAF, ATPase, and Fis domain